MSQLKELEYKMLRKMYLELEDERDSLLDKIEEKNKAIEMLSMCSTYFEDKLKEERKKVKMYEETIEAYGVKNETLHRQLEEALARADKAEALSRSGTN